MGRSAGVALIWCGLAAVQCSVSAQQVSVPVRAFALSVFPAQCISPAILWTLDLFYWRQGRLRLQFALLWVWLKFIWSHHNLIILGMSGTNWIRRNRRKWLPPGWRARMGVRVFDRKYRKAFIWCTRCSS